jgi:hypothetical protein
MVWPSRGGVVDSVRRPLGTAGRFEPQLWVLVFATMVADVAVTQYGLQQGYVEANPVARRVLGTLGVLGLWLLKTVVLCVGFLFRIAIPARMRFLIPAAIATPWTVAAVVSAVTVATTTP